MVKRLVIAAILLALVAGGIIGFNLFRARMIAQFFATQKPPVMTVSTVVARPLVWTPGIEAIGTAVAVNGTDLSVEAGGTVREVLFAANDRIEAGQKLVQISEREELADLAAAQASLNLAEIELSRARTLQERGVSAVNNLDTAKAQAVSARAQVAKLTAVLQLKELAAPFAGVIGIPKVKVGEYVTVGTVYATLQDLDRMRVDFTLSEQQVAAVKPGLPVAVSSEVAGFAARGRITGIEPKVDPNSRLVTVRAEIENAGGRLSPGQFLRVRVELPTEQGVIAVPQTALTTSLYGDSIYVVRSGDEAGTQKVEQVFVTTARHSGGLVEITRGLAAGDEVVDAGQNRLTPGALVKVDNTVQPAAAAGQ